MKNREEAVRFGKFLVVGIINTSVTYAVYMFLRFCSLSPETSNAVGYMAGVVNSFIWNKRWVFQTKDTNVYREIISFFIVFGVCYFTQFYAFSFMLYNLNWNEFLSQFIGMAIYTLLNFIFNRLFSFNTQS